jgi:hypothetical protein
MGAVRTSNQHQAIDQIGAHREVYFFISFFRIVIFTWTYTPQNCVQYVLFVQCPPPFELCNSTLVASGSMWAFS